MRPAITSESLNYLTVTRSEKHSHRNKDVRNFLETRLSLSNGLNQITREYISICILIQ